MKNYVKLHDWRFSMNMGCNLDIWMLGGKVYKHPNYPDGSFVHVSTPTKIEETSDGIFVTGASGRVYKLGTCAVNLDEGLAEIRECITKGGYTQH